MQFILQQSIIINIYGIAAITIDSSSVSAFKYAAKMGLKLIK